MQSYAETAVDLLWIPLGAGASVPIVAWNGRLYEALQSARERRPRAQLFHAALEILLDGHAHVVEMTPAWGQAHSSAGAVSSGPVGLRALGRSRLFRYEVHCWRDGVIPDRGFAVGGATRLSEDRRHAERILARAASAPCHVWGRDELGAGEMWNSNSLVAWLLADASVPLDGVRPPAGGRAPGWAAGIAAATGGGPGG